MKQNCEKCGQELSVTGYTSDGGVATITSLEDHYCGAKPWTKEEAKALEEFKRGEAAAETEPTFPITKEMKVGKKKVGKASAA